MQTQQRFDLSTEEFATRNRVKAQTVRARFCTTGSYFGVRPLKLANGRTAWPDVQVAAAPAGETGGRK
jgi:hypothetical protein